MTVMLCGLAEIRMEMSLLEMGEQLVILPTTFLRTVNATHTDVSSLLRSARSCVPRPW